jgi:hypothetical protein
MWQKPWICHDGSALKPPRKTSTAAAMPNLPRIEDHATNKEAFDEGSCQVSGIVTLSGYNSSLEIPMAE